MKYDLAQIVGMVLMGVAAATGIRILTDRTHVAWLGWLPNAGVRLALLAVLLVLGVALTSWAHKKAAALGRRNF